MSNEKLQEVTMLALQGKLFEDNEKIIDRKLQERLEWKRSDTISLMPWLLNLEKAGAQLHKVSLSQLEEICVFSHHDIPADIIAYIINCNLDSDDLYKFRFVLQEEIFENIEDLKFVAPYNICYEALQILGKAFSYKNPISRELAKQFMEVCEGYYISKYEISDYLAALRKKDINLVKQLTKDYASKYDHKIKDEDTRGIYNLIKELNNSNKLFKNYSTHDFDRLWKLLAKNSSPEFIKSICKAGSGLISSLIVYYLDDTLSEEQITSLAVPYSISSTAASSVLNNVADNNIDIEHAKSLLITFGKYELTDDTNAYYIIQAMNEKFPENEIKELLNNCKTKGACKRLYNKFIRQRKEQATTITDEDIGKNLIDIIQKAFPEEDWSITDSEDSIEVEYWNDEYRRVCSNMDEYCDEAYIEFDKNKTYTPSEINDIKKEALKAIRAHIRGYNYANKEYARSEGYDEYYDQSDWEKDNPDDEDKLEEDQNIDDELLNNVKNIFNTNDWEIEEYEDEIIVTYVQDEYERVCSNMDERCSEDNFSFDRFTEYDLDEIKQVKTNILKEIREFIDYYNDCNNEYRQSVDYDPYYDQSDWDDQD